jgi:hypothetical protein
VGVSSSPESNKSNDNIEEGVKERIETLREMDLLGKVLLIVYGSPKIGGHGSLGLGADGTAAKSWEIAEDVKKRVLGDAQGCDLGKYVETLKEKEIIIAINPVDRVSSVDEKLTDPYILEGLKLAVENNGLFILDLGEGGLKEGIEAVKKRIEEIEEMILSSFPNDDALACKHLSRLGISWDLEWMPGEEKNQPRLLNETNEWFANKHREWCEKAGEISRGVVIIYAYLPSVNLEGLQQYYPDQKTVVAVVFDGYGREEEKRNRITGMVNQIGAGERVPLVGAMDFSIRWGGVYDQSSVRDNLELLTGAPVIFFAVQ